MKNILRSHEKDRTYDLIYTVRTKIQNLHKSDSLFLDLRII